MTSIVTEKSGSLPLAKTPPKVKAERAEDVFVPLDVALTRIIGELTEMRVRQRAMLEVLKSGDFSWDRYIDVVRDVRNRDFDALFGAIVYRPEVFAMRFNSWIEEDADKYRYRTSIETNSVNVAAEKRAPQRAAAKHRAGPKPRLRKKTSSSK